MRSLIGSTILGAAVLGFLAVLPARSETPKPGYPNTSPSYPAPAAPRGGGKLEQQQQQQQQEQAPWPGRGVNPLDALGVPNKNGRLEWPLGLKILLPDEEVELLRRQIDALVLVAARQAMEDAVNPRLVKDAEEAVDELHQMLREQTNSFQSFYAYNEADRFLNRLSRGLRALEPGRYREELNPPRVSAPGSPHP